MRPCFASTWIMPQRYEESEVVARYVVGDVGIVVLSPPGESRGVYVVDPPEYRMGPARLALLAGAMASLTEAVPSRADVTSFRAMEAQMRRMAKDTVYSLLAERQAQGGGHPSDREADDLARILCRYTTGYGVLETMLRDANVQDVYVDAPSSQVPVQVVLSTENMPGVRRKCRTNVLIGRRDLQAFVSRVKFATGLPFSEAVPVLEADLGELRSRVTLVSPPLSDRGVSLAIRRHTNRAWSLTRLVANRSLSPLLAGFLWACAIGRRAVLIAGSRGAGKTTLLSSLMLEFPLSQRILLIEDTPEIPVARLQELGFDIQTLRFSNEGASSRSLAARDALRVSLRMGESAIVIGEVRSDEARVLYESMRAGSAGSSVLGTIHGNSAMSVLDRAVEDLGVSERAFSSTDVVVVIGLVRSPDGSRFRRQVVEVAEVRSSGSAVELVTLFQSDGGRSFAKPTANFTHEATTIRGISDALGRTPEELVDIVRAKAHADQAASLAAGANPALDRWPDDSMRIRSNEYLTRSLFAGQTPEAGLRDWTGWYESLVEAERGGSS
jgi:flagellar protein FlaI